MLVLKDLALKGIEQTEKSIESLHDPISSPFKETLNWFADSAHSRATKLMLVKVCALTV